MAATTAAMIGGGAIIGGIAGSMPDKSSTTSTSGINLSPATALENTTNESLNRNYQALDKMVGAGPGQSDVTAGLDSQRSLAAMLEQYQNGGYLPSAGDIKSSNDMAAQLFGAQRTALNQNFQDQSTAAARQAALMGRDINDPILRAKLAQEQTRQAALLDANQGAYAQQLAMQQPGMRLGYATDRTNLLSGLATQAMANRQALLSMGSQLQTNERNFRLATGTRWGTQSTESGGGLKGAITGAMAGAGMGMSMASGMGGLGAGGMGAAPSGAAAMGPSAASGGAYSLGPGLQASQMSFMSQPAGPTYAQPQGLFSGGRVPGYGGMAMA